ncbi:general secretion pathway protein E [Janthinobacterium sp. 35]|uniref:GspE/PulE family protein n=1 Tax=Janthinobacterium sp. 35 TaxID=2035210 RepID=UPI000C1A36B6|nr:GspE/PulE family protein [Janthinobacterium sp. 35]PIG30972.1 general secretion pathway protein E [Janthinobacterium sp. 35]
MSAAALPCPLTAALMAQARALCASDNVALLAALQQVSGWPAAALMQVLGARCGYPVLAMAALQALRPDFDALGYADCVQRGLLLARGGDGAAHLVLSDPFDGAAEDWALRRCGAAAPRVALAHPEDVQAYLLQSEQQLRAMDGCAPGPAGRNDEEVAAVITLASINDDASAVVKLVNSTLYDALKLQASDIHLECDAGCLHVLYRIDGVLVPITQVQGQDTAEQVVSRIKVMAELDIAERRVPQDGRFKVRVNGRDIDFRVSVMPNIFGEDAVLRLLDRQSLGERTEALRLEHLGLDGWAIGAIRRLAGKPHGMLLVTGPTGSGKTTTLYAAITEIHTGRDKIVTIEDPVEYRLPRVLQIPVNEKKGLTFARGLRSILRHDPDKIMVGEIRDDETAQIAVQAALTGHLVFTTLHANNVFDVLGRFLHMGVDAYSFAAALNGIVAQRLLRINCPHCAVAIEPDAQLLEAAGLSAAQVAGWTFKAGRGCGHCRGAGYKGRKAVAEVLLLDDALREMIVAQAPISQLKERAALAGMEPLRAVAWRAVARGDTTLEELVRVAG